MRKMSKKNKIVAVCAAAVLTSVGGGVAFAYWSANGSGSGSASNSAGTKDVTLHASFSAGLAPGSANDKTVTYSADNPNSSSTTVTLTSATVSVDAAHPACDTSWFGVTFPTSSVLVPAGTPTTPGTATIGTGTLSLTDLADINQDACKGATITLTLTSD